MTDPWPSESDPVVGIEFELLRGFDENEEPEYVRGRVEKRADLEAVGEALAPLTPHPARITSVTMGTVVLELASGARLTLRPVFHPAHGLGSITLAGHLAHHIEQTLGRCRVWATSPDDWTKRAHSLTVHAQAGLCAAVVYEPCFIDGPGPHLALLDNPKRLGGMLSAGILDFVEGR